MPRSEARIMVDIWDEDEDFLALSAGAQRTYFFLVSQRDLDHIGVIALRVRRWAKKARGLTADQIMADLDELSQARFVVIDEDAEELLVRSLIRRDKVFRQPNVLRAAADRIPMVTSRRLRAALADELARIAATESVTDASAEIVAEMLEGLRKTGSTGSWNPPVDRSDMPTWNPSGNPSAIPTADPTGGTPGDRGVVTAVSKDSPTPLPLVPLPQDPPAARTPRAPAPGADDDPHWCKFWEAYPLKVSKKDARARYVAAIKRGADPAVIVAGAEAYRDKVERERIPRDKIKHPDGWLNGERWKDEEPRDLLPFHGANDQGRAGTDLTRRPLPGQPYSAADQRVAHGAEMYAKYAALDAAEAAAKGAGR